MGGASVNMNNEHEKQPFFVDWRIALFCLAKERPRWLGRTNNHGPLWNFFI
jgi:hypothetical protein